METERHPVNLKQYRKVNGKWQFVPGGRDAKGLPIRALLSSMESRPARRAAPSTSNSNRMKTAAGVFALLRSDA
jgi:hypothetical protein